MVSDSDCPERSASGSAWWVTANRASSSPRAASTTTAIRALADGARPHRGALPGRRGQVPEADHSRTAHPRGARAAVRAVPTRWARRTASIGRSSSCRTRSGAACATWRRDWASSSWAAPGIAAVPTCWRRSRPPRIKMPSAVLTDLDLLEYVARKGRPMIVSTGHEHARGGRPGGRPHPAAHRPAGAAAVHVGLSE